MDDGVHNSNDAAHISEQRKSDLLAWPEEGRASFFDRWTFSYMNPLFKKGAKQSSAGGLLLTQDDLYKVPASMEAAVLCEKFWVIYRRSHRRLDHTLWRLAKPTFVPGGFCHFLAVLTKLALPLLLRALLRLIDAHPGQNIIREGLPLSISIFSCAALFSFASNREAHFSLKSGVILRAALVTAIYEHALQLTPKGRDGLTSGEVTNLVATDSQKLFEVTLDGHYVWSCPLMMVVITVLLLFVMGPSTLVGMVTMICAVPAVKLIVTKIMHYRRQRALVTDKRIQVISAMIQGIKVAKFYNYEKLILDRICNIRKKEMTLVRKELWSWGLTLVAAVSVPLFSSGATFATYVLVNESHVLTAENTFTVLLMFSILKFPINLSSRLAGKVAQAMNSTRRLSDFFEREARDLDGINDILENNLDELASEPIGLEVIDGTFAVGLRAFEDSSSISLSPRQTEAQGGHRNSFSVSGVQFKIRPYQLMAVVGEVGSGKSVLMHGLIGELPSGPKTRIISRGRVSFGSQVPFILNSTLRDNILFGSPYNEVLYKRVINACCLCPDIMQLGPFGDLTEIGERGVTLSGGQKQRVSLARVAYSQPDIAIFDDPFSALDAETSCRIFDRLFNAARNGVLSSCATILVTHSAHLLRHCDAVLVLADGTTKFHGVWRNMQDFDIEDKSSRAIVNPTQLAAQNLRSSNTVASRTTIEPKAEAACHSTIPALKSAENSDGKLMTAETRQNGLSRIQTWTIWFAFAGGWWYVVAQALFLAVDRGAYFGSEWWLARWSSSTSEPIEVAGKTFPAQSDGRSAQYDYLSVYSCIVLVSFIGLVLRSEWGVSGAANAAEKLFLMMSSCIFYAPMSYYETTPLGRILNRFTYDVETTDAVLPQSLSGTYISIGWFVTSVAVMSSILPWTLLVILPVCGVYFVLQLYYRKTGPDLQRLDALSRSPLQATLAEGLDGAVVIRAFHKESFFTKRFYDITNRNVAAMMNFISAQRWLALRVELLGCVIELSCSLFVVLFNETLAFSSGTVALLVIWSINFTVCLGFLFNRFAESEAAITAVERMVDTLNLPQERSMDTNEEFRPDASWPSSGALEFNEVCLRYRPELYLALDRLSFRVDSGKRCGVVGRTGAGKSSIMTALFRIVEMECGEIRLDGVNLSNLGLSDVRGRPGGMYIIPQDPVLFAGTLRQCLDPFGLYSDDGLFNAICDVRLRGFDTGYAILDDIVEEGGENFSVGERQLICLARALIAKPRVLVLDEATASVDDKTDQFIQRLLRSRFRGTTLLTIAHRLHTIMDYDQIVVMDSGRAVEIGTPNSLLQLEGGVFSYLVNATGEESATQLRKIALLSSRSVFNENTYDRHSF